MRLSIIFHKVLLFHESSLYFGTCIGEREGLVEGLEGELVEGFVEGTVEGLIIGLVEGLEEGPVEGLGIAITEGYGVGERGTGPEAHPQGRFAKFTKGLQIWSGMFPVRPMRYSSSQVFSPLMKRSNVTILAKGIVG